MNRKMLKSKIHGAVVTQANLHYVGSVTVDLNLLDAADILPGELVVILDLTNGARLETYTIAGERGSGVLGINGAAAHLIHAGDTVVLLTYAEMTRDEAYAHRPVVIYVNDLNSILQVAADPSVPAPSGRAPVLSPSQLPSPVEEPHALAWRGPIPH